MATQRRLARAGFTLTRNYPVPRERVWAAFAEEDQKRAWFGVGDTFEPGEWVFGFRAGGRDRKAGSRGCSTFWGSTGRGLEVRDDCARSSVRGPFAA